MSASLSAALAGDAGMLATSEYLELHLFIILYGFSVLVHPEGTGVSLRERPKKINSSCIPRGLYCEFLKGYKR